VVTRVKICGITNERDAAQAVSLEAWALGLIFFPQSPRACPLDVAEDLGQSLRRKVELVGVFVNAPLDEVAATADLCSLSVLQLHGEEGPIYCAEAARRTGCRVMKAQRVEDAAAVQSLRAYRNVDFHLLDAHVPDLPGGTGQTFDWQLSSLRRSPIPLVLSGGLTPENVAGAVQAVRPYAVDSASGTEASPGVKDPGRVTEFFSAVQAADEKLREEEEAA